MEENSIVEEFKFCCPRCGSSNYHSTLTTGFCQGKEGTCHFQWSRADDYQYFRLVRSVTINYGSREEFDLAYKAHQH